MSAQVAQLETVLRQLRLTGMLDTLEVRLGQPLAGQIGHAELLHMLCVDELGTPLRRRYDRRIKTARFETAPTMGRLREMTPGEAVANQDPHACLVPRFLISVNT